jgi:phage terminase large subunit
MTFKSTTGLLKLAKLKKYGKRKKVIQGGTSAGKTYDILAILITQAINEPMLEVSIVSESTPHLRRGAMRDFLKIMMMTGRYRDNQWNRSNLKYTFTNGSYIEFFSVEQPDKLRGARRKVLYVNEANNVPFEAYQQLSIRTSGDIWIDFNPTANFWAHTEVVPNNDADFITLTYKDNEALPQTIVDDIESAREKGKTSEYWANWWKVYGLGQVGSLDGVCITDWKQIDLPADARLLCYGMDFGYSNDPSTLVALYKYNNAYIFDEVIYQKKLLNSDISNLFKSNDVREFVYADAAEPKSIAELNTYGHNVLPCTKGKDSIVYGINLINQNEIYVTSTSKNLIKELQSYTWAKDREGNTINKPINAFDHCIDACRYAITSQLENPNKGKYFVY